MADNSSRSRPPRNLKSRLDAAVTNGILIVQLLICLGSPKVIAQKLADKALAFDRASHLRRGVNASHWFAAQMDRGKDPKTVITEPDIRLIHVLGFDHVRIPVDPSQWKNNTAENGHPCDTSGAVGPCWAFEKRLKEEVQDMLQNNLNVILVAFPDDNAKADLTKDHGQKLVEFWVQCAKDFVSTDANRVFFEILNEPGVDDQAAMDIDNAVATAIHHVAGNHTVIAAPGYASGLNDLMLIKPLSDPNVIYTFHYYFPLEFTQRGNPSYLYPSADANPNVDLDLWNRLMINEYLHDGWTAERIESEISFAKKWSHQYGVPVWCGEFGAHTGPGDNGTTRVRIGSGTCARPLKNRRPARMQSAGQSGITRRTISVLRAV